MLNERKKNNVNKETTIVKQWRLFLSYILSHSIFYLIIWIIKLMLKMKVKKMKEK